MHATTNAFSDISNLILTQQRMPKPGTVLICTENLRIDEATKKLDNGASMGHNRFMARICDVLQSIQAALVLDARRMREISADMHKDGLAAAYNRYLALQRERDTHEKSATCIAALLGHERYIEAIETDRTASIGEEFSLARKANALREKAALWEHIAQYLRFVPEAQMHDILEFLGVLGIDTKRQAIESAIRTHPDTFRTKKRGRDKFISLK